MLTLSNIEKSFPGSFEPVLKGIDLELRARDFCIIIGSNGSGKSTLLRIISGEYSIDKGTIAINGKDVTRQDRSKMIGSVTQDINKGTIPELTLLENMILSQMRGKSAYLRFYKQDETEIASVVKELGLGLEAYLNQPLGSLSGGQRQMIATLMALTSRPQILLLDEHTSALDPKMQTQLMEYTAENVRSHSITTLMVTHKLDDAVRYGNRLIMLHKGFIVFDVKDEEKETLNVERLLSLFHHYEDLILKSEDDVHYVK